MGKLKKICDATCLFGTNQCSLQQNNTGCPHNKRKDYKYHLKKEESITNVYILTLYTSNDDVKIQMSLFVDHFHQITPVHGGLIKHNNKESNYNFNYRYVLEVLLNFLILK